MASRRPLLLLVVALVAAGSIGGALASAESTPGNPTRGKALFMRPGLFCGSCHILKAAGSVGRDGPNLDKAKPGYATIVSFVTKARAPSKRWPTGSPGFGGPKGELTKAEIRDIAAFVYTATHK